MTIKKGDILERKDGPGKCKVLAVIDGDVFLMSYDNTYEKAGEFFTLFELSKYFILPKERWVPEVGGLYFYVEADGVVEKTQNNNSSADKNLIAIGNCFPETTEGIGEVEAKAEKILAVFKE